MKTILQMYPSMPVSSNVVPFEYFSIVSHYALESKESFLDVIELFATKVVPEFA